MIQAKRAHVKQKWGGQKWFKILVLFIGLYLVWLLVGGLLDIRQAYRRIDEARARLVKAQAENEELKRRVVEVQTREYIERVARNQLLMQKDGETTVMLQTQASMAGTAERPEEVRETANYLKWWNLVR